MSKELFKKMQNNKIPLGMLTSIEVEFLKKHIKYVQRYSDDGKWSGTGCWSLEYVYRVYRISPDYNPEPEIIRCEISLFCGKYIFNAPDGSDHYISEALSIKDFHRFEFADGSLLMKPVKTSHGKNEVCVAVLFKGNCNEKM